MRLLIVCLLAGVSMALAAEQPADMHAANAAATEAAPPAPAMTPESEAAPTPVESATETTDAATAAEAAPAETPADPVEAARLQAEQELAEDREFTKAGYKPKVVKGKKKYCQVVENSGTRIGKQTQCYSPEQVRAMIAAKEAAEET